MSPIPTMNSRLLHGNPALKPMYVCLPDLRLHSECSNALDHPLTTTSPCQAHAPNNLREPTNHYFNPHNNPHASGREAV